MGYDHLRDRLIDARYRVDDRLAAPLRQRWHLTLKTDADRSSDDDWEDSPWQHKRLPRPGVLVTLIVVVVAVVAAAFAARSVVSAASNYGAGKQALAAGRYDEAARKLADAKILAILPYADSTSLSKEARELSSRAASMVQQTQETADQATALNAKASADQDLRLIKAKQQAGLLFTQARASFSQGHWKLAAQRIERLLAVSPRFPGAKKLHQRAVLRVQLKPVYERALAQANARHWQSARTSVKRVLAQDGQYPGARKLLARIQAALAAKAASHAAAPTPTPPAPAYTPPPPAPAWTPPPP